MAPGTDNENVKPNQEIIESTLLELGLNRYEARVYQALIAEGTSTAKTISNITGIPYGKVYEVINSLAAKGFSLLHASGIGFESRYENDVPPVHRAALCKEASVYG
jgi:hypothetical protein